MANDEQLKVKKQLFRNLAAGLAGLAVASLFVLVTAWLQDYLSDAFLKVSLFVFPTPVACGLAVGLVSPRRAIVWAPLWSSIFALMLFSLLLGSIHDVGAAFSHDRAAYMAAGVALAALAGLLGQYASARGIARWVVLAFLVSCTGMAGMEYVLVNNEMRAFTHERLPEIIAELNENYIAVSRNLDWRCERCPANFYRVTAHLSGDELEVRVKAVGATELGLNYEHKQDKLRLRTTAGARAYLKSLGFRDHILGTLVIQKGKTPYWCANLDGNTLVLSGSGDVALRPPPGFER